MLHLDENSALRRLRPAIDASLDRVAAHDDPPQARHQFKPLLSPPGRDSVPIVDLADPGPSVSCA
jgi:hypothetical protein